MQALSLFIILLRRKRSLVFNHRLNINWLETSTGLRNSNVYVMFPKMNYRWPVEAPEKLDRRPKNNRKMPDFVTFTSKPALCLVRRCLQITRDENMETAKIGQENTENPNRNEAAVPKLFANLFIFYPVRIVLQHTTTL